MHCQLCTICWFMICALSVCTESRTQYQLQRVNKPGLTRLNRECSEQKVDNTPLTYDRTVCGPSYCMWAVRNMIRTWVLCCVWMWNVIRDTRPICVWFVKIAHSFYYQYIVLDPNMLNVWLYEVVLLYIGFNIARTRNTQCHVVEPSYNLCCRSAITVVVVTLQNQ